MQTGSDKPQWIDYVTGLLIRNAWLIGSIFLLVNVFFKPVINLLVAAAVAGIIYSKWQTHEKRYIHQLFKEEELIYKENKLIWAVTIVEALVLVVGLHFLFKGFTTVTGISESLFDSARGKGSLTIAFVLAFAVVTGMLIILFEIKMSRNYTRLIVIYVLIDVFILFPYNFIFSYENCLKDNITRYYADALPPLFDLLTDRVSKKEANVFLRLEPVKLKNAGLRADESKCDSSVMQEDQRYARTNTSDYTQAQLDRFTNAHFSALKRYINKKNAALKKIDPTENALNTESQLYVEMDQQLKSIAGTIKGIHNHTVTDEHLFSEVQDSKITFIKLFNADNLLEKDTAVTRQVAKLEVTPELPIDGFFNLLKDITGWALKDNLTAQQDSSIGNHEPAAIQAQADWNRQIAQKRYFSFLFAVLIDVFPLIITLTYIYFSKNRYAADSN